MYSIIRCAKQKKSDLQKVANHNLRKRVEENVNSDLTKNNKILIGTSDLKNDILNYLKDNNIKIRNSTTVVANEFLLTASPEFFFFNEDGSKKTAEEYEKNLAKWTYENFKYLEQKKYGVCVNAILHLDEQVPHIHCMILPIRDNKLNNKSFFRGKNSYSKLIDDYSSFIKKPFPMLSRGVSNEEKAEVKARTTIKEDRALKKQIEDIEQENNLLKNFIKQLKKFISEKDFNFIHSLFFIEKSEIKKTETQEHKKKLKL